MKRVSLLWSVLCCAQLGAIEAVSAQPGTDIYLVSTSGTAGAMQFGDPVNITDRDGYDNQPSFTPDGHAILYTSNRAGQTDIYRYEMRTGKTVRVTNTQPESEYSPTVTPGGASFTVIRVEADSTQRLWEFDLNGQNPRLVLTDVAPVGYHAWGTSTTLALFVLGSPSTLQVADRTTEHSEIVAYNIGRSLHKIPGRNSVSFAHRVSEDVLIVKELEIETGVVRPLFRLMNGNEFYAWMPDGTVITGQDTRLYRADAGGDWVWTELRDFAGSGIQEISRIAVGARGEWLAMVGARRGS